MNYELMRLEALKRVAALDAAEGWKDRTPITIHTALDCGCLSGNWEMVFDALVMLEDASETYKRNLKSE